MTQLITAEEAVEALRDSISKAISAGEILQRSGLERSYQDAIQDFLKTARITDRVFTNSALQGVVYFGGYPGGRIGAPLTAPIIAEYVEEDFDDEQ